MINKLYGVLESCKYYEKTEQGEGDEGCHVGGDRKQLAMSNGERTADFTGNRMCENI